MGICLEQYTLTLVRAEWELKLILTLGVNVRYVQGNSRGKDHDASTNLAWVLQMKSFKFATSYVLPCCFPDFDFLMGSGKAGCYGVISFLLCQGHNLPLKAFLETSVFMPEFQVWLRRDNVKSWRKKAFEYIKCFSRHLLRQIQD